MYKLTFLFIVLTTLGYGQNTHRETVFIKRTNKEYKHHFSPPPKDIETALSQINSDFTDIGRSYFKSLTEELAVLQFGEAHRYLQFTWKLYRVNPHMYSVRKRNSELVDIFISQGASGDYDEIIRLLIACLHRQLNQKTYSVSELYQTYGDHAFKALQYSIRDVNPKDTIFSSYHSVEHIFKRLSWSTLFEVISKDTVTDSITVKILRIEKGNENIDKISFSKNVWHIGDTLNFKNRALRNWKEIIKLYYLK